MICPNCRSEIAEGKKFCGRCGTALGPVASAQTSASPLFVSRRCVSCGAEVGSGKKFCGACGSPVSAVQAQSPGDMPRTGGSAPGSAPLPREHAETRGVRPSVTSTRVGSPRISSPAVEFPSLKVLGSVAIGVVVLLCIVGWYIWGVELDLITDPGGAEVVLDGKLAGKTVGQGGSLVVPHVSHGTHGLTLIHPGFDEWSQPVALGWFQISHPLSVKLPVPSFPLTVLTNPGGAKVQLDGNDAGKSDESGNLVVQSVPRGQHVVTVMLVGYPTWSNSFWIRSPFTIRADLAAAAAAAQQEIASRLSRAQMLFEQRQYEAAVVECDAVLRLEPANQQAASLKSQVQQTMSILGVR
jgi:Double zinc ribbon/PEGA domain/Fis1 C-terminal tetratricopeptide repeat